MVSQMSSHQLSSKPGNTIVLLCCKQINKTGSFPVTDVIIVLNCGDFQMLRVEEDLEKNQIFGFYFTMRIL